MTDDRRSIDRFPEPSCRPWRLFRNLLSTVRRNLRTASLRHIGARGLSSPVFLVGAPRSGTTFLGRCIAALPSVSYFDEPRATKYAAGCVYRHAWPHWILKRYYRLCYQALLWTSGRGDARLAEKTPRNCFLIPFLDSTFSETQFIHLIRDGRDAALSWSEKPWLQETSLAEGKREEGGYPYGPFPRFWVETDRREEFFSTSDFHRCIWGWRRHVEAARHGGRSLSSGRYLEVRYERLVSTPRRVGQRIAAYLDASPSRLFWERLDTARPDSVERWREHLDSEQLGAARREAGSLLRDLGYRE